MTTLPSDTSPEIERMQIERLRQMPSWRKIELVGDMNQTVRTLALAGLRQRHPDDTSTQRRRRLADLMLGRIIQEAGLPHEALNLITGYGGEIGDALVADDRGRMISFTGSLEVGRRLMAHAGLKKATLELGSNSGVIVMADADLERAADRITAGAFALAGQVCISVQRVYVHREVFDDVVRGVASRTEKLQVGDPLEESTQVGPMISVSAAKRAESWIQEALDRGGERVCGGPAPYSTKSVRANALHWVSMIRACSAGSASSRNKGLIKLALA